MTEKANRRLAVVTGGGSGIGIAVAMALALDGYAIAVLDIDEPAAKKTALDIRAAGGEADSYEVDVADEASVTEAVRRVEAAQGPAYVVVNNAGWDEVAPFIRTSRTHWNKIVGINLVGQMSVTHAFLSGMIDAGHGGRVVNISSDAGRVGSSGQVAYSGAKGGVIAFTKALGREVLRYKITANVVCPGPTDTPLLRSAPEELLSALKRSIPAGRLGTPEDVAHAVRFFAHDQAGFITGQTLSVSGGLTMVG